MKSLPRTILFTAVSLLISCAVILVLLELTLRIFTHPDVTPGYARTHATRRYDLRPYFRGRTYSAYFKINSLGLRDYERPIRGDACRIAVFGDSVAFGNGVATEKTFPKVMEAKLNERYSGNPPVEVFNFGIPSYNTVQEYRYMVESYDTFKPAVIIVEFSAQNDTKKVELPQPGCRAGRVPPFAKDMLRNLYSYNFLAEKFYRLQYKIRTRHYSDAYQERFHYDNIQYQDDYEGWVECKKAFRSISDFCAEKGITLVFAISANAFKISPTPEDDILYPIVKKVKAALKEAGVKHILVLDDAVRGYAGKERLLWVTPTDGHFNETGHDLAGKYIYQYIIDNGIITRK